MAIEDTVKELLVEGDYGLDPSYDFKAETSLRDHINLSSLNMLQIILALEGKFGISTDVDDIDEDLFESVASLSAFVKAKLPSVSIV